MRSLNVETCRGRIEQYISKYVMASLNDRDYGESVDYLGNDEHVYRIPGS